MPEPEPAAGPTATRRLVAAWAVVLVFLALQHHEVLFLGRHYLAGDNGFQNFPWHWWLGQPGRDVFAPVAEMSLGYPLWAEPQIGLCYPLNTALWPGLDPFFGFTLKLLLHVLLAAAGMFVLARREGLSETGAATAAVAFAGGAFMVHRIVHTPLLMAAAWMPWVLWGFGRAMAGGGAVWLLLTMGLAALQFLPGHPQMAVATAGMAVCYGAAATRDRPWVVRLLLSAAAFALVSGGMMLLTAAVWMPAVRHAAVGPRTGMVVRGFLTQWGANLPESLVNLVGGLTISLKWEKTAFASTLAFVAVLLAPRPGKGAWRTWLWLAVVGLILTWGVGNPIYELAQPLPLINRLRGPSRYGVIYALAGALLAGGAVDLAGAARRRWLTAVGLVAVAIALAARYAGAHGLIVAPADLAVQLAALAACAALALAAERERLRPACRWALVLLVGAELLWFGRGVNPAMSREEWWGTEENRVYAAARELSAEVPGAFLPWFDTLPSNVSLCFDLPQPISFTPMCMPGQENVNVVLHGYDRPAVLAAYGVGLVAARREVGLKMGLSPLREVGRWTLFRNPEPYRLAYIPEELIEETQAGVNRAFYGAQADPLHRAVTGGAPRPAGFVPGVGGRVVAIEEDSPRGVALTTESASVHQVIVTRAWAPGWRAAVDGQPTELITGNMTLLSVLVPPGRHRVELRYHPDHDEEAQVSVRGTLCWLVLLLAAVLRRRPARDRGRAGWARDRARRDGQATDSYNSRRTSVPGAHFDRYSSSIPTTRS